jgi:serine phosphatase RsbU (regulator of sigma subunit)
MAILRPMRWVGGWLVVVLLLTAITAVRLMLDEPGYGVAFYAVIPIVLAAFWLGRGAALATAGAAGTIYLFSEVGYRPEPVSDGRLWAETLNRFAIYVIVAVTVTWLLGRERRLRSRVEQQEQRLAELESMREALTPAQIPDRPGLEMATAFLPAEGRVAGDFFLVLAGPAQSTTIVVGDVVGHGFEAARRASFVRAVLATFAPFSNDPAQLLQLANTSLTEHLDEEQAEFVTAVCVNVAALDGRLHWASAGHHPPWMLDSGEAVTGRLRSGPLGITAVPLRLETNSCLLPAGAGFLLFTDGLIEGRAARRDPSMPLAVFGEERVREILAVHRGASSADVVSALSTSVEEFAGGALADDVCVIVCRLAAVSSSRPTDSSPAPGTERASFADRALEDTP